jgi:hypothetical protein
LQVVQAKGGADGGLHRADHQLVGLVQQHEQEENNDNENAVRASFFQGGLLNP